jgi:hypothetical protein
MMLSAMDKNLVLEAVDTEAGHITVAIQIIEEMRGYNAYLSYVLLMEALQVKDVLRCTTITNGGQFVMVDGT